MAVTVNNGTQTPVVGAETTIATIAGGPFDNVSVYFIGGTGGAGGAIGVNLYATVAGVVSRIGAAQVQGTTVGTLVEFPDTSNGATGTTSQTPNQNTSYLVDAAATTYTVKVVDLSTTPIPPGGSARATCTVTLAGVNSADTAANAPVLGAFGGLAAGATGTCAVQAGYAVQMDVAVSQLNTLAATVTVTADCGPGSVSAIVKQQTYTGSGGAGAFGIYRNLHLPVATEYTVSLTNSSSSVGTWAVTSMTYSGSTGGGGGAVVLAGEVTGPSNANVVTGPFATASLAWQAAVIAPMWTQLQNAAGAGQPMAIVAQSAFGGSGGAGGALLLQGGLGDGGGGNGPVEFAWGSPAVVYIAVAQPGSITWATGATATMSQAASAGAAAAMTITAQAAGGASNPGGALALAGGAHTGSRADGSVQVTTPLNAGYFTAVAAAPLNLTNTQSNKNVFLFTGAPAGPWQVNFLREIADSSLIFVKNTSSQTMTVAYLSGGTVTVATNTSALICSDGANLQKILTAT